MRYASDHKEKTRARILHAAGRVFRRFGYHASGIDRVMDEAGLTAGGFYAHFDSKESLFAETLMTTAVETTDAHDSALAGLRGTDWIEAFLGRYLSPDHRDAVDSGCPLAALVTEVARAGPVVKSRFDSILEASSRWMESHAELSGGRAHEGILAALALCVGGLSLSRAVSDPSLADQILSTCANHAKAILSSPEVAESEA